MHYIIGVDGGGTKTEAVAYSLAGEKVSEGRSGYGNPLINESSATRHLLQAIEQCMQPLERRGCVYVYIGLAGYEGLTSTANVEEAIRSVCDAPFTIVNDAKIAHAALLQGKDGVLTIAGTGSISMAVCCGETHLAGGWGHLLGDEGSGYWIVMQAFIAMTKEADSSQPYSVLSERLLTHLGYSSADDIKKFIYHRSKDEIAGLVPLVVTEAKELGDARDLLVKAGEKLAETAIQASNKCGFQEEVSFAIKGSILTEIPIVQQAFIDYIHDRKQKSSFIIDEVSATIGCYYLAKDILRTQEREGKERYRH